MKPHGKKTTTTTTTQSKNMSTETTTETPAVTTTVVIETPNTIVSALKAVAANEGKTRSSYRKLAEEVRTFGKTSTLSELDKRTAIAQAIAKSMGLKVEEVITTPKKGGNATAYPLLSTLCGIAMPKNEDRASAVDEAIADEASDWQAIVQASRGPRKSREGTPGSGEQSGGAPETPFDENAFMKQIENAVCLAMTKAGVASFDPQRAFDLAITTAHATAKEAMALAFPGKSYNANVTLTA